MSGEKPESPKRSQSASTTRQARLKAALKANIAKRKAQLRARKTERAAAGKDNT